jgi:hypothetical protein
VLLATLKSLHPSGYPRPSASEREQMEQARQQLEGEGEAKETD